MKYLTREELLARTEKVVELPEAGLLVKIRVVGPIEFPTLMPAPPPGIEDWPEDERVERELAWLEALPVGQKIARREETLEAYYRLIARATLAVAPALADGQEPVWGPPLTADEAKRLKTDASYLHDQIMEFSGLGQRREPKPKGSSPGAAVKLAPSFDPLAAPPTTTAAARS